MGHAPEEVGDPYSTLNEDTKFRQQWAGRVGLGFELVHTIHNFEKDAEVLNAA